jgi:hypothetical protein
MYTVKAGILAYMIWELKDELSELNADRLTCTNWKLID